GLSAPAGLSASRSKYEDASESASGRSSDNKQEDRSLKSTGNNLQEDRFVTSTTTTQVLTIATPLKDAEKMAYAIFRWRMVTYATAYVHPACAKLETCVLRSMKMLDCPWLLEAAQLEGVGEMNH
ncbi:unnamed protein product, partial [Amoebophrya sp. A25]